MKFKEFKIDLGGSYPAKSEAVQKHAFELGYDWSHASKKLTNQDARYLYFDRYSITCSSCSLHKEREQITVEKFLELTKEDVIEKEPELFYRYRLWLDDGCILDTAEYCKPNACNILEYASGIMVQHGDFKIIKFERIGEGVAGCEGQK